MTTDAIPQLHEPSTPRTETRGYADSSRRFGTPHAAPALGDALAVGRIEDWTPAQVLEVALAGAQDPNALEDADVARLCLAFLEMARRIDEAESLAIGLQPMFEIVSAENVALRHRLSGTTPVAETIAQSRTDTLNERIHSHAGIPLDDLETVVVDIPIPERTP